MSDLRPAIIEINKFGLNLILILYFSIGSAQIFIPFGFWTSKSVSLSTMGNIDGPQYVSVSHSVTVGQSANINCSSSYFSATSSNTSVLSLGNITFTGTFPNCVVSYLTTVNTGTSNVTITIQNQWGQSAVKSFVFTAYQKPIMAFSFRKIVKDFMGSAIRVRRISDDAESDIGFDGSGNLDAATYNTFKGASSLRLTTWYDQSGNSYNATQATKASQPTINLTGFSGAPQVDFSNSYFLATTQAQNILTSKRDVTIFYGTKAISESRTIFGVRESGTQRVGSHINWSDGVLYWDSPGDCCGNPRLTYNNSANVGLAKVYAMGRINTLQYIKINGVTASSKNTASGSLTSGTTVWYLGATNALGTTTEIVSSPLAEYVQYLVGLTDTQVTAISEEQKSYFGLP